MSIAAIGNNFSRAPEPHPSRPTSARALLFFTGAGILIGFGFVVIPLSSAFRLILTPLKLPWLTIVGLDSVLTKTIVLVALPAFVLYGERRPLSSIGIRKPRLSDFAYGVGAFVIGELAVYSEAWIFSPSHFTGGEGQRALFQRLPLWLMIVESIVNGITEEMTARGFAVERLSQLTHNTVAGAALALIVDLLAHIPFWGFRETIVLAPAQVALLILYLWRRSLAPCAIGHILVDLFPRLVVVLPALVPVYLTSYLSYDRQGSIYYTKGDFDRSIERFNRAIARDPHDSYAYQWRGLAYLNKKDYLKSLSDLADAIRIDPNRGSPHAHRAFVYSTKGDYQHAIADLDQAIRLEPDEGSSYEMRARIKSELRDYEGARKDLDRAIRLDPSDADLFSERAYAEYLNGDYYLAIRDYHAVVQFRPGDSDAWSDLAMAYEENKNYQRALEALAHALKVAPDSSYAYRRRAEVYGGQKKYDLALADLNKAIALDPDNPDLYEARAPVRILRNSDETGALADYDKELKLDPQRSETYVQRAWIFAAQKNNAAAIADYDSAIALKQGDASLYAQRGEMYYRTHDYATAMADWNKALELKHDDSGTYNQIAWLLATCPDSKVRNGKKAIEFATKSCELNEWKEGEVIDTLAAAYAEAGDFKRAAEFETKAIALMKPGSDTMKEASARLELYEHRRPYRSAN